MDRIIEKTMKNLEKIIFPLFMRKAGKRLPAL